MNVSFQKRQYNGFGMSDTLMSRISFSGVVRCAEKDFITKSLPNGHEIRYVTLRDEFGARFSCFSLDLASKIVIGETYTFRGEVKVGKGGTFLNLKSAEVFQPGEYTEE